jgi:uncharacterized delta-60 repeat protein
MSYAMSLPSSTAARYWAIFLLALGWLLVPLGASAQYEMRWIRNFGEGADDEGKRVVPTPDGGCWVVGYVQRQSNLKADAWIIRLDSAGRNLWDVSYGGRKWDEARTAVALPDGGLAVLGTTESHGAGRSDLWLFRLDAQGKMLWERVYGGNGWDEGFALALLRDGGFALAGSRQEPSREDDLWVIRTDAEGKLLWDIRQGGTAWDGAHDLHELPNGDLAVAGHTASMGSGKDDGWLLLLSGRGQVRWQRTYGGAERDALHQLLALPNGNLMAVGFTRSQGHGSGDVWLVQVDSAGNVVKETTLGGHAFEKARSAVLTPAGHIVLAGYTESQGLGKSDAWVLEVDLEGKLIWEETYGTEGLDKAFHLAVLADGSIVMVGNVDLRGQSNLLAIRLAKK